MRKFLSLPAILVITACASGTAFQESPQANSAIPANMGRIVVYRTQAFSGAAIQPKVSVDGKERGACAPRGAFTVDVAPGNHTVSATTERRRESVVHVAAGQSSYVRCGVGLGIIVGQPVLEAVPATTGKKESASLAFTGKY